MIFGGGRAALWLGCAILVGGTFAPVRAADTFRFNRDTFTFANSTVFDYHEGIAKLRHESAIEKERIPRYTRRCFVMCRTVLQFKKFARFDPAGKPLDDKQLAQRIRSLTRHAAWQPPLPDGQRIVFPGYKNVREMSHARGWVLQKNIGLGWPTYVRIGNYRMVYKHDLKYQNKMHDELNATLGRRELFVAFLSDFPTLHINHAVLVYGRKDSQSGKGLDRYDCYDPNHPDGPRELIWLPDKQEFNFEKDEEFVGGFARVFRVYGHPLQ